MNVAGLVKCGRLKNAIHARARQGSPVGVSGARVHPEILVRRELGGVDVDGDDDDVGLTPIEKMIRREW
jgi:hypothetical protein